MDTIEQHVLPLLPTPELVGETKITSRNRVSLPAKAMQQLGWEKDDRLLVTALNDDTIVLTRRPANWTDAYSGKMGHVFGTHEDTMRFLEEERRGWQEWAEERGI